MISIIIFGATGDLASKKTYPSLWKLFLLEKLGTNSNPVQIIGYGRSLLTIDDIILKFKKYIKFQDFTESNKFENFKQILHYIHGKYDDDDDFKALNKYISNIEEQYSVECGFRKRLFYLVLPPSVYETSSTMIHKHLMQNEIVSIRPSLDSQEEIENKKSGWYRIVIEKPFGHDLPSSEALSSHVLSLYSENQIYRIDHYLGKEMVQNILVLRFANRFISAIWNRENIKCVLITFNEDFGTYGRGQYYDTSGVIRDIIQNHTMQVLSLIAMEEPESMKSDDIKNEKAKVLKLFKPIDIDNVVLGQYIGDKSAPVDSERHNGYTDDPGVPNDSITPTFVSLVCFIENERWKDVPFILKAGKALNKRKAEVRIQFYPPENPNLFSSITGKENIACNELIISLQPNESIYFKLQNKIPGLKYQMETTELDLTIRERYQSHIIYDAYEKLILDVVSGSHINFVRSDELDLSWRLITPLLRSIESKKIKPLPYKYGTRGPVEADNLAKKFGFTFDSNYEWYKRKTTF